MRRHADALVAGSRQGLSAGSISVARALAIHGPVSGSGRTGALSVRLAHALVLSLCALAFLAAPALAGTVSSHPLLFSLDGSSTPAGSFGGKPYGVAVDQSTHSVYVVPNAQGTIDKFDTAGNPVDFSALGTSALDIEAVSEIPCCRGGTGIEALAVDNSGGPTDGNIFVSDGDRVFAFDSTGAYLYMFNFYRACGLAVDSSGALYVRELTSIHKYQTSNSGATHVSEKTTPPTSCAVATDPAGNVYFSHGAGVGAVIQKYDSLGTLQSTINLDEPFSGVRALAVDPATNHLFATYGTDGGGAYTYVTRIDEFNESGGLVSSFGEAAVQGFPVGIAVDGESGKLFVSNLNGDGDVDVFGPLGPMAVPDLSIDPPSNVSFFSATLSGSVDPAGVPTAWHFEYKESGDIGWKAVTLDESAASAGLVSSEFNGLQQNTQYQVRLVATNTETSVSAISPVQSLTTLEIQPPTATIDPVSQVTSGSVHLTATINPHEFPTNYRFEYSSDDVNWAMVADSEGDAGSSNADVPVSADLLDLAPNTQYFIRVIAVNSLGQETISSSQSFTTAAAAPIILASPSAIVGTNTAVLRASLLANGPGSTYHFEYGLDSSYGTTVPVPDKDAGSSGLDPLGVSAQISGLSPNTIYHFRLVVSSPLGTSTGTDHTFKTADPAASEGIPDGRVYEKVSPSFKNGAEVRNFSANGIGAFYNQASSHGDAITWWTSSNFDDEGTPVAIQYLSKRGASGWTTEGISPKLHPRPGLDLGSTFNWFSDDLSLGVISTTSALLPGGIDGGGTGVHDLYLRDMNAPNDSSNGAFELLTQHQTPVLIKTENGGPTGVSSSEDGRQVLFEAKVPLVPGGDAGLYEWVDGQINYLGGAIGSGNSEGFRFPGFNPMSADGKRIYHKLNNELFVHEDGVDRLVVAGGAARFWAAERSTGSVAFFSSPQRHTPDATASESCHVENYTQRSGFGGCPDLYRWDAEAPPSEALTDLTTADPDGGGVLGVLGLSDDASKLYFTALGQLAPGATEGVPNLYLWQKGKGIRFIATVSPGDQNLFGVFLAGDVGDRGPEFGGARVTPDGQHLLFDTSAQITPYDNDGHKQLYLYSLASDEITCISCNTRTTSSTGDSYLNYKAEHDGFAINSFLARNLSSDGSRVFFDSTEALVPGDTNGKIDVYEWTDGKVQLITTGDSARVSNFMGASDDGTDVFFATQEPLVRSDGDDVYDIYDARVGGIPEPSPIPDCVGDECQGTPTPPPAFDDPGTSGFVGPGNPGSGAKKRCPKGKHRVKTRGKTRCVKQPASKPSTKKHR